MPNQNQDIQRKAGFFHSLGKVITERNNDPGNENYKSAHNVRSNEVWMDEIPYAIFGSASVYSDGIIVRQIGSASGNYNDPLNQFDSPVYLYPLTNTNYQTWFLDTGTPSAYVDGYLPSDGWVKPLINPSDVSNSSGAPSDGYQFRMYRRDGTSLISYGAAYYDVDYFAGLIRFDWLKTPIDASGDSGLGFQFSQSGFQGISIVNGATFGTQYDARKAYLQSPTTGGPRVIAWQYVGQKLSNYNFTGGGSVSFADTTTIGFTQSGVTYSAYIQQGSITASLLNTGLNGGATAGYILSNDGTGNFEWVLPSTGTALAVADYDTGLTFSSVQNIIFRGGVVSVPPTGGTATGVLVTGPTPTVTVWIPAPPQAVYASHFNTTDGNTNGVVYRTLSTSVVRISNPTSEGNPFETNGWAGTDQSATIQSTPVIQTYGLVTGFSETISGDSKITVNVYRADGTTLFTSYQTPVLYQNGIHSSGTGITVSVSGYSIDDSGFPAIYTTKWKAAVNVSVDMSTIFFTNSLDGGRYKIRVYHFTDTLTDGGVTYSAATQDVFYDTNSTTPSISGTTTIIESTTPANIITKHISGVEYYTTGSEFEITTTGIDELNRNTQGWNSTSNKNFTITAPNYNLPTYNLQAWSPTVGSFVGWSNIYTLTGITFAYTNWTISASSTFRYRGPNANATSQDFDPWGNGTYLPSTNHKVLIDQVSDNSSRLGESFNGETERLIRGASSYTSWISTTTLGTGISNQTGTGTFCDACVVGGYLVRPDKYFLTDPNTSTLQPDLTLYKPDKGGANPDYSSYSQKATYHRKFYTTSVLNISSFLMAFSGSFGSSGNATTALANSQLKIYVRRIDCVTGGSFGFGANPLALHGGQYNSGSPGSPFNDGATGPDTLGSLIRTGLSSGNNVYGSFGTYPAKTGFWVEIQIVDPDIKIDVINVTLNFANNTTDSLPVS